MNKSMFRLMRVRPKLRRLTLNIRLTIAGKTGRNKVYKLIRDATITKNRTNNKAYVEGMVDIITSYDAAILP